MVLVTVTVHVCVCALKMAADSTDNSSRISVQSNRPRRIEIVGCIEVVPRRH